MDELKPCPFCGSDAGEQDIIIVGRGLCKMVFCEKCHIDFKNPTSIEQWNTRPAEDALKAEVDGLLLRLEKVKLFCKQQREYYMEREKTDIPELKVLDNYMVNWCNYIIETVNSVCTEKGGEGE